MQSLGGGIVDLALRLLPSLPIASRFLPKGEFPFLALSNAFVGLGNEADWFLLVETLMATRGAHTAMWLADKRCPIDTRLRAKASMGGMAVLAGEAEAHVMAGFANLDEATIAELCSRPTFVSPLDPT